MDWFIWQFKHIWLQDLVDWFDPEGAQLRRKTERDIFTERMKWLSQEEIKPNRQYSDSRCGK